MFYQYASAVKEEKINKCEQCGKIIRDARNLKRHMQTHEKVSKFCKKCKKYRIDIDTFENHFEKCDPEKKKKDIEKLEPINTEGSKWFPCPFCEFKSLYEPLLKKYMTICLVAQEYTRVGFVNNSLF